MKKLFILSLLFCWGVLTTPLVLSQSPPPMNPSPAEKFYVASNNNILSSTGDPQVAVFRVGFILNQAVPNGTIEVLLRASDNGNNNGTPDVLAYDFGGHATNGIPLTCPTNLAGYTFVGSSSTPDYTIIRGTHYHRFTCTYNGTGAIAADFTSNPMIIGNTTTALINPSASDVHLAALDQVNWGEAPAAYVRLLDKNENIMLSREVVPTLNLDGVRVTAHIMEELAFRIAGTPVNTAACGALMTDASTATEIIFNNVTPEIFSQAAQRLEIISSARSGYALTVSQNDQMALTGHYNCPGADGLEADQSIQRNCIPDATVGSISPTQTASWTNPSDYGLAYTLEKFSDNSSTSSVVFNYAQGYRQLADRSASEPPVTFAHNTFVTNQDLYYVCYKLAVSPQNYFGAYENSVSYILTATF